MSTENTELLERAVINLTIDNAKLKKQTSQLEKDKEQFWGWYKGKADLLEKKEQEVLDLQKKLEHHLGLPKAPDKDFAPSGTGTNEEETE